MSRVLLTSLLAAAAAGALAGCATLGGNKAPPLAYTGSNLTPTEQFGVELRPTADRIQLAPKPGALSPGQVSALGALAARWRENKPGPISIEAPAGSQNAAVAAQAAQAAVRFLTEQGVPHSAILQSSYNATGAPLATVAVGFESLEPVIPECWRYQSDFTKSANNKPYRSYGCSTTANIAAMVANPRDLLEPRGEDPSDGARRAVVLGKYRQGEATATQRTNQERGAISDAVQ
jgi:pilus assembly protein CpaD